jgi:hypothetical protein
MSNHDYDWFRFWVHFVCGALLGAGLGFFSWMHNWHAGLSPWLPIGGSAFALALLGGIFGDRFWDWFLRNLRWW